MNTDLTEQERHQAVELAMLLDLMDLDPRNVNREDAERVRAFANNGKVRMMALKLRGVRQERGLMVCKNY